MTIMSHNETATDPTGIFLERVCDSFVIMMNMNELLIFGRHSAFMM
jgi:hypothetical protein